MREPSIHIKRIPYEEPYHVNLLITADNGQFSGYLDYYCNASALTEIGKALEDFPRRVPDEYLHESGSPRPEERCAYHFALRAYTTDMSGHCALQITMANNQETPTEGSCLFSIPVEAAALNRLGKLLCQFGKLTEEEMHWAPRQHEDTEQ